jgi:hypothetical protein
VAPEPERFSARQAERAARRAVSRIRRGCHFVSTGTLAQELRDRLRWRATPALRPECARAVAHRTELLAPA